MIYGIRLKTRPTYKKRPDLRPAQLWRTKFSDDAAPQTLALNQHTRNTAFLHRQRPYLTKSPVPHQSPELVTWGKGREIDTSTQALSPIEAERVTKVGISDLFIAGCAIFKAVRR